MSRALAFKPPEETTCTYNGNGSRGSIKLPNGVYTQYQYNGLNRLTELIHFQTQPQDGQPLPTIMSSFGYSHYADGMRATAAESQKKTTAAEYVDNSLSFRYDGLNRLMQEAAVNPDSISTLVPNGYGYTVDYEYDLAGNRTLRHVKVTRYGGEDPVVEDLWTDYEYEPVTDRLVLETHSSTAPSAALPWGQGRMYVYASPGGKLSFGLPGSDKRFGQLGAFWRGLPSVWNRVVMAVLMALLPLAAIGPMVMQYWRRMRGKVMDGPRPTLSLYHRCLCVLFAYIFLIGPENIQSLAAAEIQYANLHTTTWGQSGQTIEYGYDDNGSQIRKTTKNTSTQQVLEELRYDYTLRGNLQRVVDTNKTWDTPADDKTVVAYRYNPDGIRVGKTEYVDGVATTQTSYLIDPYNHTGYAQVLEEWTGGSTPAVTYTIGDDVIGQTVGSTVSYLLYDGHGSTRQLSNQPVSPSLPGVIDNFSYDAYGMMLGGNPTTASPGTTKLLYAGEQFDPAMGHYYLRARYYNPSNGRFNRTDPFEGNPSDPQSLHKYLYAHCNPVNATDPLGLFSIPEINVSMVINTAMRAWTCYSIYSTAKKAYQEGIGALTFFDWLFLGLDVLHVTSALSWLKMTSTWKKQAQLFHNLGDDLAKAVGRARSSIAGQLGTRMHEALKSSWLGKSVAFLQRQLSDYGVLIFIDQAIGTGIGGRPDITIILRKFKIGIAFDLKPVPKTIFYSGVLPSYKYLFEQGGQIRMQREGATQILQQDYGATCLYFYIPYPSFVN